MWLVKEVARPAAELNVQIVQVHAGRHKLKTVNYRVTRLRNFLGSFGAPGALLFASEGRKELLQTSAPA